MRMNESIKRVYELSPILRFIRGSGPRMGFSRVRPEWVRVLAILTILFSRVLTIFLLLEKKFYLNDLIAKNFNFFMG